MTPSKWASSLPILLLLMLFTSRGAWAQSDELIRHHVHHPTLLAIDKALQNGSLSADEAILQKFYAGYNPQMVNSEYTEHDSHHIKCMLPVQLQYQYLKNKLSISPNSEIEQFLGKPSSTGMDQYLSPSGNFTFFYETSGDDAVPPEDSNNSGIPDYVEKAAFAADSSYRHQVEQLGFEDFRQTNPYEIYFENIKFYGTTNTFGATTTITVHNNFENFPENGHPERNVIGALYVTIAHEIKHAIQYATNRWEGSAGSFDWIEMDATMMEEILHDDVNDYYNYIKTGFDSNEPRSSSIFGSPELPIPGAYDHVTWMLYFAEQYGMDFWVDVWGQFRNNRTLPFLDAVEFSLLNRNKSLQVEHLINQLWHLSAGPLNSLSDFGFEERYQYPVSFISNTLQFIPDSLSGNNLQALAANYSTVEVVSSAPGQPEFMLNSSVNGVGLGVVGYFRDGSTREDFTIDPSSSTQTIQTTWNWSDLQDIKIAVVNTNRSTSANYNLTVSSKIPDRDLISQNYPNPFNPTTRIEFSVNSQKNVRIDIFDSIGRRIQTLVNRPFTRGFHFVEFDGSSLSTGIYFYRIVTGQISQTRKMILIK
jgi:hypothetical protein